MLRSILLLGAVALSTPAAALAERICDRCCCQADCRRVCRAKCEMVEETEVTYDCQCEEVCIPGPSKCLGKVCVPDGECGHKWQWNFSPTCGKVKTAKKLVRVEKKVLKPKYTWVVERLCSDCARCAPAPSAAQGTPPTPSLDTRRQPLELGYDQPIAPRR